MADQGDGFVIMRDLPAHHEHQEKAEEQEAKSGHSVLNPDDLMIGGKNVLAPKTQFFLVDFVNSRVRDGLSGCVHFVYFISNVKRRLVNLTPGRASIAPSLHFVQHHYRQQQGQIQDRDIKQLSRARNSQVA